jgi:hypothetical protein
MLVSSNGAELLEPTAGSVADARSMLGPSNRHAARQPGDAARRTLAGDPSQLAEAGLDGCPSRRRLGPVPIGDLVDVNCRHTSPTAWRIRSGRTFLSDRVGRAALGRCTSKRAERQRRPEMQHAASSRHLRRPDLCVALGERPIARRPAPSLKTRALARRPRSAPARPHQFVGEERIDVVGNLRAEVHLVGARTSITSSGIPAASVWVRWPEPKVRSMPVSSSARIAQPLPPLRPCPSHACAPPTGRCSHTRRTAARSHPSAFRRHRGCRSRPRAAS